MNPILIRPIQQKDFSQIPTFLETLGYPQSFHQMEETLETYSQSSDYTVLVAVQSDRILGFIALSSTRLFVSNKRKARIESLIVEESSRRKGIGKLLMTAAEEWCRSKNCDFLELTSGMRRAKDGSHDFYKSLGYKNEGTTSKLYLRKYL